MVVNLMGLSVGCPIFAHRVRHGRKARRDLRFCTECEERWGPMYASRVLRLIVRAVPAVLVTLVAAATFAVAGGVASADPTPRLPSLDRGGVTRLAVAPGQNSTGGSGTVVDNKVASYSIPSANGQKLIFDVTSNNGAARVNVAPLVGPMAATEAEHAEVVGNGFDYQITVYSADGSASDFTLNVTVA